MASMKITIPTIFPLTLQQTAPLSLIRPTKNVYGHGKYKLVKNKLSLTYRLDKNMQQYECTDRYIDLTKIIAGNWQRISDVSAKYKYT